MSHPWFIAADVGNARIKLGLFADDGASGLVEPRCTLPLVGRKPPLDRIDPWLARATFPGAEQTTCEWWIASVNRPAASGLVEWLHEHRRHDRVVLLASGDLPLVVRLEKPDMVGIDRLVDAVAVNRLRDAARPAVIVDVGTAITIDLVSAEGAFLGGTILPGIQMSARALHHFTDLLPLLDVSELAEPPPVLGDSTESAMKSGLFWGTVGGIRHLIDRLRQTAGERGRNSLVAAEVEVFLTGGAGPAVVELLGCPTRHVPNLTLMGIAQVARDCRPTARQRSD